MFASKKSYRQMFWLTFTIVLVDEIFKPYAYASRFSTSAKLYSDTLLMDWTMPSSNNMLFSTTELYQLETMTARWIRAQLQNDGNNDLSIPNTKIYYTEFLVKDQVISTVDASFTLKSEINLVYSGEEMDDLVTLFNQLMSLDDKSSNDPKKESRWTALLQSWSEQGVFPSVIISSSLVSFSSLQQSDSSSSLGLTLLGMIEADKNSDTIIFWLIIVVCVLSVSLIASFVFHLYSSSHQGIGFSCCHSQPKNRQNKSNDKVILVGDILHSKTDSLSDGTISPTSGILGAKVNQTSNIIMHTNQELQTPDQNKKNARSMMSKNYRDYDMETPMSELTKGSEATSVASRNPLGIMSMQALRKYMFSPQQQMRSQKGASDKIDPYNMSRDGDEEDEGY